MSKSLPVYDLSQWIKSDRNIGYVVARSGAANAWDVRDDYKGRKDVERFMGRGDGYVIQWVELQYCYDRATADPSWTPPITVVIGSVPRRLSWLRAETIAERRYQPCENPVKVPVAAGKATEQDDEGEEVTEFERGRDGVVTFGAPSQPVLPLDIEAATEATMRAAVALGNQAADWLRAKGLTL